MGTILKIVVILAVLALLALVGFSYYPGSLTPPQSEINRPVSLDVQ